MSPIGIVQLATLKAGDAEIVVENISDAEEPVCGLDVEALEQSVFGSKLNPCAHILRRLGEKLGARRTYGGIKT
jgi:hypothetical protein